MKIFKRILIVGVLIFLSCKKANTIDQNPKEQTPKESYESFVESFYDWYFKNYYNKSISNPNQPKFIKNNEGKFILDTKGYANQLNEIAFLSSSYKKILLQKCEICSESMERNLKNFDPEYDADFYLGKSENQKCDFLWSDLWLSGQGENLNSIKVIGEQKISSSVTNVFISTHDISGSIFSYVTLSIGENKLREKFVDNIVTSFKKPKIEQKKYDISSSITSWNGAYDYDWIVEKNSNNIGSKSIYYRLDITKDSITFLGQGYQTDFYDLCTAKQEEDTLKLYYRSTIKGTNYNKNEVQPLVKLYKKGSDFFVKSTAVFDNTEVKFEMIK